MLESAFETRAKPLQKCLTTPARDTVPTSPAGECRSPLAITMRKRIQLKIAHGATA
jgi:hypothetical protein